MSTDRFAALIEKEKKNIERYEAKKAEYEEKIKVSKANLDRYEMMQNSEKFDALSAVVQKLGLSMEDVANALRTGDLLSLQERMEAEQSKAQAEAAMAAADDGDEEIPDDAEMNSYM